MRANATRQCSASRASPRRSSTTPGTLSARSASSATPTASFRARPRAGSPRLSWREHAECHASLVRAAGPAASSESSVLLSDERATDLVADEAGLLVAVDLEHEARDDLEPAAPEVVDLHGLCGGTHLAAGGDRRGEAHLVPAVVDAEDEAGRLDQLLAEAVDQAQRQVAVRHRRAEWALGLGPLDIDVDPLVVAGEVGEGVDHLLGHFAPLARANRLAL